MKTYSVIDIGTNSIRLLMAEVQDGCIVHGTKHLEMTRLGKGVDESKMLSQESMGKTFEALKRFKEMSDKAGAEFVGALATSAVRDSRNREEFVRKCKELAGVEIEVISGKDEAELGYLGVLAGIKDSSREVLIIDIGGGSTELIVGDKDAIRFSESYNVGAVRMTGKHLAGDPPEKEEIQHMDADIENILAPGMKALKQHSDLIAIGIGGTATTFGAMDLEMEEYDRERIHNYGVEIEAIKKMCSEMETMTVEERKNIKGLQPKRADIIYAGGKILMHIMEKKGLKQLIISDYDNLEGYLVKKRKIVLTETQD